MLRTSSLAHPIAQLASEENRLSNRDLGAKGGFEYLLFSEPVFQYAPAIVVRQWELTLLKDDQVK